MMNRAPRGKIANGALLRELRIKQEMSQEALAGDVTAWASSSGRSIEITQSKISDIEKNVRSEQKYIDAVADYVFQKHNVDIRMPNERPANGGPLAEFRFYDNFFERRRANCDVPKLIVKAEDRIIISGISLFYLSKYCEKEVIDAAERGVTIALIVGEKTPATRVLYAPYVSDERSFADPGYEYLKRFRTALSAKAARTLGCYSAKHLITHSIGVYDQSIYVSELCLVDNKGLNPSYSMQVESPLYALFENEAYRLLAAAKPLFGSPPVGKLFQEAQRRRG
jgi:transcriptional regulator with XRE-family HTH domain